ncbi:hypothetical protein [Bacillus sp. B15-48]|uniref:hypothetical protein n=1 Tax=Bacillus sp. B15-48 TaxID=1548601 RepID=UPI00193EF6B9|nr:hypothetical protein [Bacillus sp. B15-48]MBM4761904.1 hypothetical protein [Bacillus sp. B15-48]
MDTVIIVTLKVNGLPAPIKIASQQEPTIQQIYKMIVDIVEQNDMSRDIQFKKFLQENEQKMYVYEIGERKCVVLVEKLAKVIDF